MYYQTLREELEESKTMFLKSEKDEDDERTAKIKNWISKGETYESVLTKIKSYKNISQKVNYLWAYSLFLSDIYGNEGKSIDDFIALLENIFYRVNFYNDKEHCIMISANRYIGRKLVSMLDTATDEELLNEIKYMNYKLDLFLLKNGKYQIFNRTKKMYYDYAYTEEE